MSQSLSTLQGFEKLRTLLLEITECTRKRLKNSIEAPEIRDLSSIKFASHNSGREIVQKFPMHYRKPGRPACDVVITANEITESSEVGRLIRSIFGSGRNCLLVRSRTFDHQPPDFGRHHLEFQHSIFDGSKLTRKEICESLARTISSIDVGHILSVPTGIDEVITTCALARMTGAPLAVLITDDELIQETGSARGQIEELFALADIALAASPELRVRCEESFAARIWMLPFAVDETEIDPEWIWDSAARGEAADSRFEKLFEPESKNQ